MKKLISFYLLILLPVLGIIGIWQIGVPGFTFFLILSYVLLYRPYVHFHRLKDLGIVDDKEFWHLFIPFYSTKYFDDLYFRIK